MSLDIQEGQVLVHFPGDAVPWHHRVLLCRVSGGLWVVATPDLEVQTLDVLASPVRAIYRGDDVPDGLVAYMFDLLDADVLAALRAEGRRLAEALGASALPAAAGGAPAEAIWCFADTGHPRFGLEVPGDWLGDATRVCIRDSAGLVQDSEGQWTFMQRIDSEDTVEWKDLKRTGDGRDERLGPAHRRPDGGRSVTLKDLLPELVIEDKIPGWPFRDTPRATKEFFAGVVSTGHELIGYAPYWVRMSGLAPQSGLALEFVCLMNVLQLLTTFDQYNIYNSAGIEMLVRRALMVQRAVKRNCKSPDFSGLDLYLANTFDGTGGIVTSDFDRHIAEQQRSESNIMKQARLWHEEIDSKKKSDTSGHENKKGNKGKNQKKGDEE
jgi:hypothetical protein